MGTKTCLKCGKGGSVLVCRSSNCLVAIHESCMPSSLQVHDEENFFCPYCLYKQSVAECRLAKEKALLAERNLTLFSGAKMSANNEHELNITKDKWATLQNHEELGNQERVRKKKERVHFQQTENDPKNGECSLVHVRGMLSDKQASSSTPGKKGGYLRKCKRSVKVARHSNGMKAVENQMNYDGQFCGSPSSKWEGRVLVAEPVSYVPLAVVGGELVQCHLPIHNYAYKNQNYVKNPQHLEPLDYCNLEKGMELEPSECNLGQRNQVGKLAETDQLKRNRKRRRKEVPCETAICSINERAEIYKESHSVTETYTSCNDRTEVYYSRIARHSVENAIKSKNYSLGKVSDQPSGHEGRNTVIASAAEWIDKPSKKILDGVSYPRRKRVRWTIEEEEMIKKGVLVFSAGVKKNLPWRKVLEFGSHVFHQSRTPVDLQSKWKIMSRKEHLKSNEA